MPCIFIIMSFYLSQFLSIRPRYEINQEEGLSCLIHLRLNLKPFPKDWDVETIRKRITRFGLASSKIASRGTEIQDYVPGNHEPSLFVGGKTPDLSARMDFFKSRAEEVMGQFYSQNSKKPDHLVHVTCTGYIAPSAAQKVAAKWARSERATVVTHAYHMGCYASLPAIRIGLGFQSMAAFPKQHTVDIVHQEICYLHFDPTSLEAEQIVVQSLFADGHIRYSLSSQLEEDGFQIFALKEQLLPETSEMMSWIPRKTHFEMHLGRDVPIEIKNALKLFVISLLKGTEVDENSKMIFAIHPGGPKIIEAVQAELSLSDEQTAESHAVLKNYGNMSSSTLPHIWKSILENQNRKSGDIVVSLAFSPGLTLSGSAFKLCRS